MRIKTIIIALSLALTGCNSEERNIVDIGDLIGSPTLTKEERENVLDTASVKIPSLRINGISNSTINGLYELRTESGIFYVTHDFNKIIKGELFDVDSSTNETKIAESLSKIELEVNRSANVSAHDFIHGSVEFDVDLHNETTPTSLDAIHGSMTKPLLVSKSDDQAKMQSITSNLGLEKTKSLKTDALKSINEKTGADVYEEDTEMKAVREALAAKFRKIDLDADNRSEIKREPSISTTPNATLKNDLDVTVAMDGRVNPDDIKNFRTHITYKGQKIPKIGYDSEGNRTSANEKKAKVQGIVDMVKKAGDSWSFNYIAENEKASIVVFTDPTCPYCRKLHQEIPELNKMGISVYNLFYPRQLGLGLKNNKSAEGVIRQTDKIWFADDRHKVANDLYEGYNTYEKISTEGKKPNPVFEHYLLGEISGMRGTPHILLSNGKTLRGFYNAKDINKYL